MEPGDTFEGTYRLVSELGRGGHATVFLGEHVEIGQKVAIKVMHTHSERFTREGRVLAQLSSPHTVRLLAFGRTQKDEQYLISEWVDGESLTDFINRRSPVPPALAVDIIRQILVALDEAHRRDIVHRDIKPGNVMLVDENLVKVLDFGVAKLMGDPSITATHEVLGTPRYMAPETLLGDPVTPSGDIFAVGMLAYALLVGKHANSAKGDVSAIVARHLSSEPYAIPDDIELGGREREWLNSLMAKNPSNRPSDAAEALEAMNAPDPTTQKTPAIAVGIRNPADAGAPTEVHRAITAADRPASSLDETDISAIKTAERRAPSRDETDVTQTAQVVARRAPVQPTTAPKPIPSPTPASEPVRPEPAPRSDSGDRPSLIPIQAMSTDPPQPAAVEEDRPGPPIVPILGVLILMAGIVVAIIGTGVLNSSPPEARTERVDPLVPKEPIGEETPDAETRVSTEHKQLSKRAIAHFDNGELVEALRLFHRIEQSANTIDKEALQAGNYRERAIQQVLDNARKAAADAETVEEIDAAGHEPLIVHSLYRAHPDVNAVVDELRLAARKAAKKKKR